MFLDPWSLSLTVCGVIVLFLVLTASRTAVRVLLYWDPDSDGNRQIRLEGETWLSSTLLEYALVVQLVSLVIFVMAADHFSRVITGAMCATGSFQANAFGLPALYVKIAGFFLYSIWLLIHRIDISSERYPLVRCKYIFLLALVPWLFADLTLQTLYIAGLKPDIITSCCAVVFSDTSLAAAGGLVGADRDLIIPLFYGTAGGLVLLGGLAILPPLGRNRTVAGRLSVTYGLLWSLFFPLALVAVITVFSSYIYALPNHRCPFCIIKPEYHYIGLFIYLTLMTATFLGISIPVSAVFSRTADLGNTIRSWQRAAILLSLVLLGLFLIFTSWHYLFYLLRGGE